MCRLSAVAQTLPASCWLFLTAVLCRSTAFMYHVHKVKIVVQLVPHAGCGGSIGTPLTASLQHGCDVGLVVPTSYALSTLKSLGMQCRSVKQTAPMCLWPVKKALFAWLAIPLQLVAPEYHLFSSAWPLHCCFALTPELLSGQHDCCLWYAHLVSTNACALVTSCVQIAQSTCFQ